MEGASTDGHIPVGDFMVRLMSGKIRILDKLYRGTPCRSIYARVAEFVDCSDFRLVHAGEVIPNNDLKIGETNLVLHIPANVYVCPPIGRVYPSDDEVNEDHGEVDDDGSKDGGDQSTSRDKGDVGKGGGAAGGGAASGGEMGGNGGSSSAEGGHAGNSGGGALGVLGRINRIMVKSTLGHEFTISNTSLGTTACELYESIAVCAAAGPRKPADALRVIHSGRWLPNDNSELGMTTLGGSHAGKLDELHLTVVVR